MKTELVYLVAVEGDMSAHGMGDKAHVIPFDILLLPKVSRFLKAQLDDQLACFLYYSPNKQLVSRKAKLNKTRKFWNECSLMREIGIFEDKYDSRTTWTLMTCLDGIKERMPNVEIRKPVINSEVA